MSRFTEYIGSQFGNPRGIMGKGCCLIMNTINRPMYMNLISVMKLNEDDKILDIGYGNGFLLQKVYKKFKSELHGIDISEDMKEQATKRNRKALKNGKLHLQVGDCCNLPYEDALFSAISSINTVYFWSDPVKGLTEIRRALKSGKSFYNVVYTKEWLDKLSYTKKGFQKYETKELIRFGKEAGFEHIEVKDIVKGKSYVVIYTK
ncbi:MAG: class I SAM-dependent methyltransferase [bacterium]|nr:class I SAM-dependent methyltransferase [bacterium]